MRFQHTAHGRSQRGIALLIAIFALLLISGAAIGMVVMSGMESAVNANYRRSTITFYHGMAGLEEARERMVPCSPNSFWPAVECTTPGASADPLFSDNPPNASAQVLYVINPNAATGDPINFNPQAMGANSPLLDGEIGSEYSAVPIPPAVIVPASAMTQAGGQAPLNYKWVRVALKTEFMGGVDMDGDGNLNEVLSVRVDSQGRQCLPTMPNCVANLNAPISTRPVFRVTASAVSPTGERRMLQAEMAQTPIVNPNGAIASQAGVTLNGNFNAFGAWPPIVTGTCGSGKSKTTGPTCGTMSGGNVAPDCNNPFSDGGTPNDPTDDTCGGRPRPYGDYCNLGTAANTVSSAGNISSGNYDTAPDNGSSCSTQGSGCIYTISPNQALAPNTPNWPYDMNQIIDNLKPPVTQPIQQVDPNVACGVYDANGNRSCSGSNVQLGTLPSPWPPAAGTTPTNYTPKLTYADVGPGGVMKITANGSAGSGILVVDGDLEVNGGFEFYGLIVVRGTVRFLGGGSGGVNVIGGILAGSSVTNVTQNTVTGGSVAVTYSSCAFRFNNQALPLRYLSFREISR
jgi:hypothetical protein